MKSNFTNITVIQSHTHAWLVQMRNYQIPISLGTEAV